MKNWVESLKKNNSAWNININIINQFYIKLLLCTDFKKSLLIKLFLKRWVYNDSPDLTARNSEAHRTFLGFGKESTQMVAGHAVEIFLNSARSASPILALHLLVSCWLNL